MAEATTTTAHTDVPGTTPEQPQSPARKTRGVWLRGGAMLGVILALFAVAVFFAFNFVAGERDRALQDWQTRLSLLADGRTEAVGRWVDQLRGEIGDISEREYVGLYVGEMLAAAKDGKDPRSSEMAPTLRNLLVVTAQRTGFNAPPLGPKVDANVGRQGVAGIAIVDAAGRILLATPNMPAIESPVRRFLATLTGPYAQLYDLHRGPGGLISIGVAGPIRSPAAGDKPIAYVLGLKPVGRELYPLLKLPAVGIDSAEAILIRRDGAVVTYLSPLRNGDQPLVRQLALNSPDLAAAAALKAPGAFIQARDYAGNTGLGIARTVPGSNWVLLVKVNRDEALGPANARMTRLMIILSLALLLALAALAAVWRHGASRRATVAADNFADMARRYEKQSEVMRLLTDSQPNAIYFNDADGIYHFANQEAALRAGMDRDAMSGKTLTNVLGADRAKRILRMNREALEDNKTVRDLYRFEGPDGQTVLQSKHIPVEPANDTPRGVMVVEEDITSAVLERERRERNLQQVVRALVDVLDRRDPNAANHSARTAEVCRAIAAEMGMDSTGVDTAGFVGQLFNIGKTLVPQDILTKSGGLTAAELKQVHQALDQGGDLLEGIEFDGPVVAAVRQGRERYDGMGPKGLAGDDIQMPARIAAVANAFVAMVSSRAHRKGLAPDAALDLLLGEAGTIYDRKVVAALVNYVENKQGRPV
jgi:PAS domain S-box-containing protein